MRHHANSARFVFPSAFAVLGSSFYFKFLSPRYLSTATCADSQTDRSQHHGQATSSSSDVYRSKKNFSISGDKIIYKSKDDFDRKIQKMIEDGPTRLQIVSDFDFTLTKFWMIKTESGTTWNSRTAVTKTRMASCHKVIEDCNLLSPEYHESAQGLQKKYYPLEIDPTLDMETRTKYMIEWVTKAHQLLIDSGLSKSVLQTAVKIGLSTNNIQLRDGVVEFLDLSTRKSVPVLIFSAGISDVLTEVLLSSSSKEKLAENVFVVSNKCNFDLVTGALVGFHEPIFHVFNKKAAAISDCAYFKKNVDLDKRRNILLLGDSIGDLTMTEGLLRPTDNIIRVGFLNDKTERLPEYLDGYDVVLLEDPDISFPASIVDAICRQ